MVSALNSKVNCLTGKKPAEAITEKAVTSYHRPVGVSEKWLPSSAVVHYLYQPSELEGAWYRATDRIWSLKVYRIKKKSPNPMNQFCIICMMGPSETSFARNFLLCLPTPSCCLPHSKGYSICPVWTPSGSTQCLSK